MSTEATRSPAELVQDVPRVLRAVRQAVREALLRHKQAGQPVPTWRDGRVVWIPPEEFPPLDEPDENDES